MSKSKSKKTKKLENATKYHTDKTIYSKHDSKGNIIWGNDLNLKFFIEQKRYKKEDYIYNFEEYTLNYFKYWQQVYVTYYDQFYSYGNTLSLQQSRLFHHNYFNIMITLLERNKMEIYSTYEYFRKTNKFLNFHQSFSDLEWEKSMVHKLILEEEQKIHKLKLKPNFRDSYDNIKEILTYDLKKQMESNLNIEGFDKYFEIINPLYNKRKHRLNYDDLDFDAKEREDSSNDSNRVWIYSRISTVKQYISIIVAMYEKNEITYEEIINIWKNICDNNLLTEIINEKEYTKMVMDFLCLFLLQKNTRNKILKHEDTTELINLINLQKNKFDNLSTSIWFTSFKDELEQKLIFNTTKCNKKEVLK